MKQKHILFLEAGILLLYVVKFQHLIREGYLVYKNNIWHLLGIKVEFRLNFYHLQQINIIVVLCRFLFGGDKGIREDRAETARE